MKATRLLLFSLFVLILCGQSQAFGQTYDLQFVVVQNNGTNLDVKMQVKATGGSFGMGDANLVFSYPASVLGSPVLLSAHNFNSGFYSPMTITKPSGRVSANIVFDGSSGLGTTVSSGFVDVATIRFNVLNPSGSFTLAWRSLGTGKTVVFNDLFALVTPGTFTDLSSMVAPLITSQPTNQSVLIPLTATFSVTATGGGSVSYQWQKNSANIGGATGSTYTTPATTGSDSGAVFRCIVTNGGGSATSNGAILTAINNLSGIFSDDFSGASLDPRWTFVNPLGDATLSLTGAGTSNARLSISVPAGVIHDLWTGTTTAPRLLQAASNTDFEVAMKFESAMSSGSQILGLMVQQDTANYLRFDFVRNSASSFKIFAARIKNGTAQQKSSITITAGNPIYLKVKRGKSVWTSYYSLNGTTWTQAANFSDTLTMQKIGPFAGNAPPSGGGSVPAFTALVDYFFNTQGPISPEDPPAATSPLITSHPSNETVAAGLTATFAVSATGTAPLSFQWQKNAVDIGGATSPSYTTPATILADSGATFRCRVTNSAGNVTSNSAVLNVGTAPGVSSHPANQTVIAGATANFSVTATGTQPLSFQWQKNGVDIGGAASSSYTTPTTSIGDSGATFRCRVTNTFGNVTSNSAILNVVTAPNITSDPANETVTLGSPATFSVTATGTQPLAYQWQKNGANIGGATLSSYTTPATIPGDSGAAFRCRVSNAYGSDTSNSAILNVVTGPAISTHPSSDTVAVGATATFTVVATGTPTLLYQWQKNGSNIGGATNPSYTTPATTLADSGATFRCVVSNAGGNTTSNSATLSVLSPPNVTTNPVSQTVAVGDTATFSVVASGSVSLVYQWQKNDVDIGGATSTSYTTPALITADSGTTYRCIVTNAVGADTSNAAVLSVSSNTDASEIISDNFNSPSLNTSLWTFVNPLGDALLTMTGSALSIGIPAGVAHDAWTGGNFAPRILQNANNTDFQVETKFTAPMSVLPGQFQSQGIIIQNDSANYIRFDFVRSATTTKIFSATVLNNTATQRSSITITAGNPLYLRVKRIGNAWISYYSYNGTTWTTAANYSHTLVVSKVGLFFVNAGTSAPAFTGVADYFLNTEDPPAATSPLITSHPSNETVAVGLTATFAVSATGTAPLSYQWQKNGVDIGVATSPSYTTPSTVAEDSGTTFRCRVTNSAGNVTSNSAVLNVGTAPGVSSHPANQTVIAGATANFSVTATGTQPLSFQWQKNGVDIGGAASSSYTTPTTSIGDSGATFRCRVTNTFGNVTSNSAILNVVTAPNITSDPANETVTLGSPATFSVTATGTQPLAYQWQKNGANIGGATLSSYTTPATIPGDSGAAFRCRVSNAYGSDTSNSAILNVVTGPAISTHPSSDTVAVGATATFTVVATGTPTLLYQWQKNGSNIGGATNPSYTTPATTLADSGATFRCVVSNGGGSTTSNSATLSVLTPPTVTTDPASQTVAVGGTATFSVVASGSPSLVYQWQKNNVDIGGATAASYVTPAAITADSGTTYRCIVANAVRADTSNTAVLSVSSNTDASGILSDNFNSPSLNTSLWTFINPLGDAPLSMTGNGVSIAIPAGTAHDAWTGGNFAPRILQNANNTNFQVEAKYTTAMSVGSGQYQSEGIIVQQDSVNYLRFDFVRSSSATKIYSARIKNNTATQKSSITITAGNPLYMRVKRIGHAWTSYYSYNGTTWTTAANYNDTLVVVKVGPFFVNAGTPPPAFTGVVDYFFNTAFPIVPTKAFGQQVPEEMPTEFGLSANYPNPFNPSTTIRFALPVDANVTLRVYNALGQEIRTLVDEARPAGFSYSEWDGRNVGGEAVSSGMYFYRIEATSAADPNRSFSSIGKMILMK